MFLLSVVIFLVAIDLPQGQMADGLKCYNEIKAFYDSRHPPQFNNTPWRPHFHAKRCTMIFPHEAVSHYRKSTFNVCSPQENILVGSPCLGSDSLGNVLGSYLETMSCAQASGMNYAAVAKIWEPKKQDISSPFYDSLPSYVKHEALKTRAESLLLLPSTCTCQGSCHEYAGAAWVKNLNSIVPLLRFALLQQLHLSSESKLGLYRATVVRPGDLATVPQGTELPFIPDAAVHYRCGDNFVGSYGFVPFHAVDKFVPADAKSIYILAEHRGRKTSDKPLQAKKCDVILHGLFEYVRSRFPAADVILRRGDDLFADMARLAYAKVSICSVSTFCLWPAVMSNGTAYFPRTDLVVGGDVNIDLGFNWFSKPAVVLGAPYSGSVSALELVTKLRGLDDEVGQKSLHRHKSFTSPRKKKITTEIT